MSRESSHLRRGACRGLLVALLLCVGGCGSTPPTEHVLDGSLTYEDLGRLDVAPRHALAVALAGPLAIVGCGADGVVIADASRPDAPLAIATLPDVPATALALDVDRLFAAIPGTLLHAGARTDVDLLDPRDPLVLARAELADADCVGLAIEGANVACVSGAGGALRIGRGGEVALDVAREAALACAIRRGRIHVLSAPRALIGDGLARLVTFDADSARRLGDLALAEPIADAAGSARGTRASIAVTADGVIAGTGAALLLLDAGADSGPTTVRAVLRMSHTAVAADRDLAAVACDDGVYLLDLAHGGLALGARVRTVGAARGVAVMGDLVAIADDGQGLRLIRVARAGAPPDA